MAFRVCVLGIGNAFSALHHPTSFLVQTGDQLLLIDCPDRLARVLRDFSNIADMNVRVDDLDSVYLTHLHGDHCNGLEDFAFYKYFLQRQQVRLYSSPSVMDVIWENRLKAAMGSPVDMLDPNSRRYTFDDFFVAKTIRPGAQASIGNAVVTTRPSIHPVPTCGIIITYRGKSWGYAADTAYNAEHVEWLSGCDLIMHEVGEGGPHTPYHKLAAHDESLRSRMRIVHMPDDFSVPDDRLTRAEEGEIYDL